MTAPRHMSPGRRIDYGPASDALQHHSNFGFIPLRWNMVAGCQDASRLTWLLSQEVVHGYRDA